jgi:hypothetical protein
LVLNGDLQGFVSKDGGVSAAAANAVTEIGQGVYKLTLSQAESDCDSGNVQFVVGSGLTAWWLADPVSFQTSDASPVVGLTAGIFDQIRDTIKGATYDGDITQTKLYEMLTAFMYGKVDLTPASGVNQYTFRNASGATSFTSFCSSVDGTRLVGGITG